MLRDGVLAAVLLALVLVDGRNDDRPAGVLVVIVVGIAALVWRRTLPLLALGVTGSALCLATVLGGAASGGLAASLIGVYSAIAWGRRFAGTMAALVEIVAVAVVVAVQTGDWADGDVLGVSALLAIAVAAGFAVESRRSAIREASDRAERAEQTRELEAARRVAEERLRIARELHDVLGHHVAVIGVQAGVAEMLLATDTDAARTALVHVQDAAESVLSELGALVEVLRETDDDLRAAPAQGMSVLDRLLDDVRSTGLALDVHVSGEEQPLAPVVDLTAFRVIQEALTNAHKHGSGRAQLLLAWTSPSLTIEITNPLAATPQVGRPDGGHGLVGMRERVASVGGAVLAASDGTVYRVSVVLPTLPPPATPAVIGAP
ncbi:signal transduction histidine kinase [Cellulomonas sp. PhB150]|nr:signal transduction histidine kinase [Cellulomonas sp. PhB150]